MILIIMSVKDGNTFGVCKETGAWRRFYLIIHRTLVLHSSLKFLLGGVVLGFATLLQSLHESRTKYRQSFLLGRYSRGTT